MKLLVEWHDESIILEPNQIYILGRDATSDIRINSPKISRNHLRIEFKNQNWNITDLRSSNGTFINRKNVTDAIIQNQTKVSLGGQSGFEIHFSPLRTKVDTSTIEIKKSSETVVSKLPQLPKDSKGSPEVTGRIRLQNRIRIGRDESNDWVIPSLSVSRFHAEISQNSSGDFEIADLKSVNGTFVNGEIVNRHQLITGDLVTLGSETRRFSNSGLEPIDGIDGVDVLLQDLSFQIGGKVLIDNANVEISPSTLTAIIGPSGAGKSTLLRMIAGQLKPSSGKIKFNGNDFAEYKKVYGQRIGYVPQSDILHTQLTTQSALQFGAALRLPGDTTSKERDLRVQEVMEKLELGERANLRISKLSGGQRKRASIGLELLTSPDVLLLDEPTSGLDPGLDAHVMETLRNLADDGQTVVLVTHSVDNLHFCDNVILLASGGHVAYSGPASTVFSVLKKKNWSEVFKFLASSEALLLSNKKMPNIDSGTSQPTDLINRRLSAIRQTITLSKRYFRVISSDKFYSVLLVLIPIITGLLCYLSGSKYGFGIGHKTKFGVFYNPFAQGTVLVLVLGSIFIGLATGIQEIVKEREIRVRETAAGLKTLPYLVSKLLVLGIILIFQELVFTSIVLFNRPMQNSGLILSSSKLEIILTSFILAFTSLCLALLISSLLTSPEQAMPSLVGLTMIGIVMSGALPIATNNTFMAISKFMPSYWATNAIAASGNLVKISLTSSAQVKEKWAHQPETITGALNALAIFILIFIAATYLRLRRKK